MNNLNKQADSEKIIERVRKLLAMGTDVSSEYEAAIAMKRARSLMDEHQITLADIEALSGDDLGVMNFDIGSSRKKLWMGKLSIAIASMNDCVVTYARRRYKGDNVSINFKGFNEDIKLCEFMLVYLVDTCNRLYQRDRIALNLKGLAQKNDFYEGFAQSIKERIATILEERLQTMQTGITGTSLIVAKLTMVEEKFGNVQHKTLKPKRDVDYKAYTSGENAGNEVHLGSFCETDVGKHDALSANA